MAATRIRDTTVKAYRRYARPVLQALGAKPLKTLTPANFQVVYAQMLKVGRATSTIHHTHVVAHSALSQAVTWGLIPGNPTERVKPPRVTEPEIVPPSAEDVHRLFDAAATDRLQALWWLIALTGLRKGEALALQWGDIDWEARTATIQRTMIGNAGTRSTNPPKTKRGRRVISLSPYLVEILRQHQQRQYGERMAAGSQWVEGGWVFTTRTGT